MAPLHLLVIWMRPELGKNHRSIDYGKAGRGRRKPNVTASRILISNYNIWQIEDIGPHA